MIQSQLLQRAQLLINQGRFDQASDALRRALVENPNNGLAHALLGYCMAQDRDQLRAAHRELEQAIHLSPDDSTVHYLMAIVCDHRGQTDEALAAIEQSIALDPENPDSYGAQAHLLGKKKRWEPALEAAENGLKFDPENQQCLSLRIHALERLGRVDDAVEQAETAIRQSPDSADAHASRGWALLQSGDYRESQKSFREALRLEPSNEFARQGMMQALNSSNFLFRFFYGLLIRLSRLDSRVQWGLIIGAWVLIQVLNNLANSNPALEPFVFPLTAFYLLFVMMSWIIHPLFNTFLRFHPFGKYLLSRKEVWSSNLIGGTLVFGIVAGVVAAITNHTWIVAIIPILHGIYLTIPISVAFNTEAPWAKLVSALAAIGFGLIYLFNSLLAIAGYGILPLLTFYTIGVVVYCFLGQWLIAARPQR